MTNLQDVQLEFLEGILELSSILPKFENSVERQEALFLIRRLGELKLSAGEDEDSSTVSSRRMREMKLLLVRNLSTLGSESLLDRPQGGNRINVQESKS